MDHAENMLSGSFLSAVQMEEDLEVLASCYEAMGISSELIPATQLIPLPTLTAILTDETGFSHIISHSWLTMPQEVAARTKYLQFYSELMLPELERTVLLEGITGLNEQLPLGHCFLVKPEHQPEVLGLRWIQSFPLDLPPDRGCFSESVAIFDYSCQLTQEFLNSLAEGKTTSDALKELQ